MTDNLQNQMPYDPLVDKYVQPLKVQYPAHFYLPLLLPENLNAAFLFPYEKLT